MDCRESFHLFEIVVYRVAVGVGQPPLLRNRSTNLTTGAHLVVMAQQVWLTATLATPYELPLRAAECLRMSPSPRTQLALPLHSTLYERWDKLVCGPCHNAPPKEGQPMKLCRLAPPQMAPIAGYTWANALADGAPAASSSPPADEASVAAPGSVETAACVVGGLRTFSEPVVQESLSLHLPPSRVDLFLYLYLGEELSARGQGPDSAASAASLRALASLPSTRRAIATRIQTEENAFRCAQMATGRFYKIARCVEMVKAHATPAAHQPAATDYYAQILIIRPDVLYFAPFAPPAARCLPSATDSGSPTSSGATSSGATSSGATSSSIVSSEWISYQGEVLLTPYANIAALSDLEHVRCCNVTTRTPRGCFHRGLDAPWMQYLLRQVHNLPIAPHISP